MQLDLRILELLASKICHDLVSPVGAINNGVELIDDVGGGVVEEAMKLIGDSAEQAARRLRLFRLVYGRAGSEGNVTFKDINETVAAYFAGSKIRLHVAPGFPSEALSAQRGVFKVLLNLILLADEALPYGGDIHIGQAKGDFAGGLSVMAQGRGAALGEASLAAFDGSLAVEAVTPRTVHAYVAGKFAAHFGFRTGVDSAQSDHVILQAVSA